MNLRHGLSHVRSGLRHRGRDHLPGRSLGCRKRRGSILTLKAGTGSAAPAPVSTVRKQANSKARAIFSRRFPSDVRPGAGGGEVQFMPAGATHGAGPLPAAESSIVGMVGRSHRSSPSQRRNVFWLCPQRAHPARPAVAVAGPGRPLTPAVVFYFGALPIDVPLFAATASASAG